MGSCENLTSVDEPLCDPVSDRHLCLETNFDVVDANVNGSMRLDGCLGLSNDDATPCVGSADVGDTGIGNKDGLTCEYRNLGGLGLEKVLDDECGVGRVCSNDIRGEIGVCNSPDRNLGLSRDQNNICVSSANVTEVIVGDRDGSLSECENVACSVLEKLEHDVEQGICLNESQSKLVGCCAETNGLCMEKRGLQGEDLESFEHRKLSLGEVPSTCSLRNCDRQDKQKGDRGVNFSSVEEAVEAMDEETNVLAEVKVDKDNRILSTDAIGMSLESMPVADLLINCVQQHGQKGDNTVSYHSGEEGVMIEKSDALAELEKDPYGQAVPSRSFENPSDLKPVTGSPRYRVQQDEQKDERSDHSPTPEGDMDNMEEKTDALDRIEKVTCDQILTSQFCEMPSELLPFTVSPRNSTQQDDRENDNNVGCSFFERVMEGIDEKTDVLTGIVKVVCDQMLPSECCEMSSEVVSVTGSPRNCVQLGHQEKDKNDGPSSSEGLKEKIDFVGGIENDICHPRPPSEHIEFPMELASSTGFSSCYTLQNVRKGIESIGYAAVEGKGEVAAMEANTCNCISASRDGEMPFKVSCEDDLMRTCEGRNNQMDHDSVGLLAVGNMKPKGNSDTCIVSLHSCQSSLESLNIVDSQSNSSHQTEKGNNMSIYGLSAESVTETVEERSDVTTDVKVEVCSLLSSVEETIKEQSSRVVPNSTIEKPVSLQSSQPSAVGENGSCKSLDINNLSQKDDFGAISSSSAVDGFGQMDHGGKDDVGASCFSETKYPNIVSSSARKISRTIKSSTKTQTKRATRNSRTIARLQQSHGSIDIIFNIARRKRSCFSKPARSSMWGLWSNITQFFGKSDVNSFSLAQNQGSQKARGGHRSQKRNKVRAGGSSSRSSRKCNVSTRCLRLKVKVGKEICQSILHVVVPKEVDTIGSDDIVVGDDRIDSYPTKNSEFPQLAHEVEETLGAEGTERQFQCLGSNPEEVVKHPDDSILDIPIANQAFKAAVIIDKSAGDVADDNPAHKAVEVLGGTSANNLVDPGTSPDSEVINLASDAEVQPESQEGLHRIVLTSSEILTAPGNVKSCRGGKKKTNLLFAGNSSWEDSSPVAASMSKAKPPKKRGSRQKLEDVSRSGDSLSAFPGANRSSHSSSCEEFCGGPLPYLSEAEPGIIGEDMVPSIKSKGCTLSKNLKSDGRKKGRSKVSNSRKSRRKKASTLEGNQRMSVNKNKVKDKSVSAAKRRDKGVFEPVDDKTEDQSQIGSDIPDDIGKTDCGNNSVCVDVANVDRTSGGELEHYFPPENAWVQCDDCYKWRRIPVSLANSIDKNCRWVCKDNMDTTFADCSIPQEKTNADINAELGLSDHEEDDGLLNYDRSGKGLDSQSIAAQPGSSFRRIDTNVFLNRTRKTQTIDEVMVCHCKPPSDGQFGCGDECLNRMLNIECVQGTCPCCDLCSNQQFQKHKYAKMQWRPCGKKGYGLELLEHVPKGKFIIEYVGEVLDMQAYEARQKEYAANGHKHFYFMTLNGSEVIDACDKGNLGRFINHSCDPNCRTEKWMVNGEICIGLFAMRDIKEGEELTFDYNYVRVFGAAAKKCHCGSPQCRGYIGGDLLNTEIIYQGDSDEEYPEPRMLEDGETGDDFKTISRTSSFYSGRTRISEATAKDTNKMDYSSKAVGQLVITGKVGDSENQSTPAISQLHHSMEMKTGIPISSVHQEISEGETMKKTSCRIPQVESSSPVMISGKSFPDGSDTSRKSKCDIVEDNRGFLKSRPRIKTSRKSGSVKKGNVNGSPLNGNKDQMMGSKSQILLIKPKKIMEGSSNSRFEAVQEKLNELLDAEGGISKRKDAPKGYLKLLLLTAASGGSGNGESIQSNRDLSMILDALLKTKSRVVLMDIINKNGLQMLHNMIKQYRRDFKKIPILRKLLKVLEYLAMREILTQNHIAAGPPCPGMESFRGSILSLTEHDDKQVHQIARSFRDKWIPKSFRKHSYMDRDDSRLDIHRGANFNRLPMLNHRHDQGLRPSEAIDCVMQSSVAATSVDTAANEAGSSPSTVGCRTDSSKTRKRKSRWDQPAKINLDSIKHKEPKLESRVSQSREDINCPDHIHNHCNKDEAVSSEDGEQITQEDVPPGFSYPFNPPLLSSDASSTTDLPQQNVSHSGCAFDMAIAQPQTKFNSHLPVSYGIPLHFLQQFGSPQAETVDSWGIAPGMPFRPFPPLPPFPREKKETPPASDFSCKMVNGSAELKRPHNCCTDENNPSTTEANQSDADTSGTLNPFKRMRGSSNDLGKRYFRQQKWKGPPWLWRRNEFRNSYCSQDVSCSVDKPVSNFYQRPPQQNHH